MDPYLDHTLLNRFNSGNIKNKQQILREISTWFLEERLLPYFNYEKPLIEQAIEQLDRWYKLSMKSSKFIGPVEHRISPTHPKIPKHELIELVEKVIDEIKDIPLKEKMKYLPMDEINNQQINRIDYYAHIAKEFLVAQLKEYGWKGATLYGIEKTTSLLYNYNRMKEGGFELRQIYFEEEIISGDREAYKKRKLRWPGPEKIEIKNCSQELADFLEGQPRKEELGFIADFKPNANGVYLLHLGKEGYGTFQSMDIFKTLPESTGKFKKQRRCGFGHTHGADSETNIFSGKDIGLLEICLMFRPHVLFTQNNGILYLPFNGFFYLEKNHIKIVSINKKKKLIDAA